jgi:trigger factor
MNVTVEQTSALERRLTVALPAADIDAKVSQKLQEYSRSIRLPGFRPGKVPFKIIQQRFAGSVRAEVCEAELQPSYAAALEKEELRPAGPPAIEPLTMEEGKDFEYTAVLEVYPEFEVKGQDALTLDKPTVAIGDSDVEDMLEKMRAQHTEWTTVERAAAKGDRAKVTFTGTIDGEEFAGGNAEGIYIQVGAGNMPEVFEGPFSKALTGAAAGDTPTCSISFPDDYETEEMAGKTADYSLSVEEISEGAVPDLNDEFAEKFGVTEGGIEKLRANLVDNMNSEVSNRVTAKLKEQVIEQLLAANDFEVPKALIGQEVERLRDEAKQRMGQQGLPVDTMGEAELPAELFEEQANRRVKVGLVFGEIIKANELTADEAKVDAMLDGVVAQFGEQAESMKQMYRGNAQAIGGIESAVLENQVVDFLSEKATITEVATNFEEIVAEGQ